MNNRKRAIERLNHEVTRDELLGKCIKTTKANIGDDGSCVIKSTIDWRKFRRLMRNGRFLEWQ